MGSFFLNSNLQHQIMYFQAKIKKLSSLSTMNRKPFENYDFFRLLSLLKIYILYPLIIFIIPYKSSFKDGSITQRHKTSTNSVQPNQVLSLLCSGSHKTFLLQLSAKTAKQNQLSKDGLIALRTSSDRGRVNYAIGASPKKSKP